jgi:hypothetical protein
VIDHLDAEPSTVIALEVYLDRDGRLAIRGGASRPLRELGVQAGDTILITKAEGA